MRWTRALLAASLLTSACSFFVSLDGLDTSDSLLRDSGLPGDGTTHHIDSGHGAGDAGSDTGDDDAESTPDVTSPPADAGVDSAHPIDAGSSDALPVYVQHVLEAGPYAYWRFEDPAGQTTVADQMGAHPGSVIGATGATLGVPGEIGRAISFNGTTGCVEIQNGTDFEFPDFPTAHPFSIELWVLESTFDDYAYAVTTEQTTEDGRWGWTMGIPVAQQGGPYPQWQGWNESDVDGGFDFGAYSNGSIAGGELTANTWTYLVGTFDGSNAVLYVNGIEHAMNVARTGLLDAGALSIGCLMGPGNFIPMKGQVDEVAVYKYVLNLETVDDHYAAATGQ